MNEPMTLVERLRNPQWVHPGKPFDPAILDTDFTIKTMREAADELERQKGSDNSKGDKPK